MRLRTPSRRSLLEENRTLRMTNAELNEAIDKLVEQIDKDTDFLVIGNRMAKCLRRSSSPVTKALVAEWEAARGA